MKNIVFNRHLDEWCEVSVNGQKAVIKLANFSTGKGNTTESITCIRTSSFGLMKDATRYP